MPTHQGVLERQRAEVLGLFRSAETFSSLDDEVLGDLVDACDVLNVPGGTVIAHAGQRIDALYGVLHGAMRLSRTNDEGGETTIREFYRGEIVGVLGMFVERPAPVDGIVIRDSTLIRLPRERFLALARKHPSLQAAFTGVMGAHLLDLLGTVTAELRSPSAPHGGNLAVIAYSLDELTRETTRRLVEVMQAEPGTARVTAEMVDRALGKGASTGADPARVTEWLSNLEHDTRALIYQSDAGTPAWTAQCVRQADRVVVVLTPQQVPRLDELAARLVRAESVSRQIHLVMVHPASTERPSGTRAWSRLPGLTRIHHVKAGKRSDLERVVRNLMGRPIGVALGGGGARGIAHVGVLAAMDEAGIPVDYICGTSMGAIFAAGLAQGFSIERIRESVKELFASPFALYDLTLPVSSLLAGRKLDRVMRKYYGDADIEDLWLPFFCVSTDLSRARMVVHERGPLWKSVRASCSIPGIFPPLAWDGRMLVDGGLMDNLPIDLLAKRCPGTIVSVDVSPYGDPTFEKPPGFIRSRLRAARTKIKGEPASPPLFDILIRSTFVGSKYRQVTAAAQLKNVLYLEPPVSEFGILSWRSYAELFDAGYRYAKEMFTSSPFAELSHRIAA